MTRRDVGVHVLGQRRLPHRRHVHVRADARSRGRVAADLGVARGDGRRVGALRSVGAPAARRRRRRARVRVGPREPRARRCARRSRSSSIPTTSRRSAPTTCRSPRSRRRRCSSAPARPRRTSRRSSRNAVATPCGNPHAAVLGRRRASTTLLEERLRGRAVARRTTSVRRSTARPRSCSSPVTAPGRCATRPGVDRRASTTAPIRTIRVCAISRVSPLGRWPGEQAGVGERWRRGRGARGGVHARGARARRGARPR